MSKVGKFFSERSKASEGIAHQSHYWNFTDFARFLSERSKASEGIAHQSHYWNFADFVE